MAIFSEWKDRISLIRVLILGSYHPDNLPALLLLQQYLIEKGLNNVVLIKDLDLLEPNCPADERMSNLLSSIESEMNQS